MPTTWNCPSGNNIVGQLDVQNTINNPSVVAGDTILVPPGNFTWTVTVTVSGKALFFKGSGIGVTNITDQASAQGALSITATATNFITVSDFTFIASTAHASGVVQVNGTQFIVTFRIHHCRIVASVGRGMSVFYTYGLVDHVDFESNPAIQMLAIHGGSTSGADGGFLPWREALTLGQDKACYVEQCTYFRTPPVAPYQAEDAIDAYAGARLVLRDNQFFNCKWGFHGTDSGSIRSPVSFEVYRNTIQNDSTFPLVRSGTIRGGTGVVYDNTSIASPGSVGGISLISYRACDRIDTVLGWGGRGCDGSNYEMMSASLSSDRSRVASAILGGTVGATTNAAGYGLDQTVITLAAVGSGTIAKDDHVYFGTAVKSHRVTSTSTPPGDLLVVGAGGTITIFPAIGRRTDGLADGETIPAVATTITNGGFKFSSTVGPLFNEQTGAEGGVFTRYLDSGGALNAGGSNTGTCGYPCRDQPGVGPGQVVTPIWAWGNVGTTMAPDDNGPDNCQGRGIEFYIQNGRDYINDPTPQFGPIPKPGYTPLAFPHYLQGSDTLAPAAPTNLTVTMV